MFTVRRLTLEFDASAETVFSRLDAAIEKVERLTNPLLGHSTVITSRPWVGKVDPGLKKFRIIQTSPFFNPRLFQLLWFALVYLFFIPLPIAAFINSGYESYDVLGLAVIAPALLTILLMVQLEKMKRKLGDVLNK